MLSKGVNTADIVDVDFHGGLHLFTLVFDEGPFVHLQDPKFHFIRIKDLLALLGKSSGLLLLFRTDPLLL